MILQTIQELKDRLTKIEDYIRGDRFLAEELTGIKADLIVNCNEGRPLHKLGINYDESATVRNNNIRILRELLERIQDLEAQTKAE